ncbi:MAG TPA: efflux RND transporter permease subunit [Thermoanaerobaculia bacterium]|nr:efflux RND transporter permease subunit [Thermoanaerobaculia bacterium]
MTPRFFIDRPVFSWVIALAILLAGVIALRSLPVEQYPSIAPPSLNINVFYPGADAEVLATNVTQVIEQELNGVEGFLYMTSTSLSNGSASITVTFRAGTDIDAAQMNVQNRLRSVEPRLPEEVRRQGIQVDKASTGFLMIVALTSKSGATPTLELGNFAVNRVVDELRRVPGVGDVQSFSSEYAMRVWLDPDKLASYRLTPSDAMAAVAEQNSQSTGGALGDRPLAEGSELNAPILTQGRFSTAEEFSSIILRANPDGSVVRLGDVARVELGAQSYLFNLELDGKPAAGMAIQLTPGANALSAAEAIKERMAELERGFPPDIGWTVPFDTTLFIDESVTGVVHTLVEAMVLVFLVMFLFLQNWRATLIPTIVVPIALAGACLGLWMLGFSINVLTLFAMVMAIGILVDDAIVVIENVERIMAEEHLPPYDATVKAMRQITSAVIGITLVLVTVFVPMAFFPGSTGGIYRQFAVTLAISIAFSALLALTLTPALCATLLKPHAAPGATAPGRRLGGLPGRFFGGFNRWFARATGRYQRAVGGVLSRPLRWLAVFVLLVALTGWLFLRLPGSFLPAEDQGYLITVVQAPAGATTERTDEAIEKVKSFYVAQPETNRVIFVRGFSFFGQGQAHAIAFVSLQPWEEREGDAHSAHALVGKANGALFGIPEAMVFTINPPSIPELGVASGFTMKLQDRGGHGYDGLLAAQGQLLAAAAQSPVLAGVRPEGLENTPQLRVDVDRIAARALGLSIGDVNSTLAIAFGSAYASDFSRDGRILRVLVAADAPFRMTPEDVLDLRVRNERGEMVPFGAFTTVDWTAGPAQIQRYNGYPAMTLAGMPAPGRSTGEAMAEMARLAEELPEGFDYEWTGVSYEEQQASGQVGALLALSLVVVFLLLAALYESWTVPISVLLIVPLGVLGSVLFSMMRGLSADVYFNVGLITIIGLAAKNAILIVEFAIEEEAAGKGTIEATLSAVRLRLRPIVMTSLAFILGMVPLVISTGAGAASRIAVGTGVMGGMLAATLLGIFFIPLFYLSVRRWIAKKRPPAPGELGHHETAEEAAAHGHRPGRHDDAEDDEPEDEEAGEDEPHRGAAALAADDEVHRA